MLWHEVAGVFIQTAKAKELVKELVDGLDESIWQTWLETYGDEIDPSLPKTDDDSAPSREIRIEWMEEFVEDAVGVLCLGNTMAEALRAILSQHYGSPTVPETGDTGNGNAGVAAEVVSDFRHPPPSLRVQVALSLSAQMRYSEDLPVQDQGANTLACMIFGWNERIVSRVFSQNDEKEVARVASTFDKPILKSQRKKASSIPAYILIPAALRAFKKNMASGHRIREAVAKQLTVHLPPKSIAKTGITSGDFLKKVNEANTWEAFTEHLFSETDQGTAEAIGNHSHPLGIERWMKIRISGVTAHFREHSDVFLIKHEHDGNQMEVTECKED
jgi:hypothetical protein